MVKIEYFNFRIIEQPDGVQVIDNRVKTEMDTLTPEMQLEYMEVYEHLVFMERMKRKVQREREQQRENSRNPLYKIACAFGLV